MFRVLVGTINHETNTFSPFKTSVENFKSRSFTEGEETMRTCRGTQASIGAFIDVVEACGHEAVPTIRASAMPSGIIYADCVKELKDRLLAPLKETKVDGILLELHGAMVTDLDEDGDGYLLENLRKAVGPDVPIMITLDLHVNLTQKMIDNADVLIPCNCYPHTDMYDSAKVTAQLMMRTLRKEIKPRMAWRPLPIMAAMTETENESFTPIVQARKKAENTEGILAARVAHGFFLADTTSTGVAMVTVADDNMELAQRVADEMAETVWEYRSCFNKMKTYTPEEALADAEKQEGTVTFADICDNPGGGSTCDGTNLLRAMLNYGVQNAVYGIIYDPETAEQCHAAGVGSYVDIKLGGKKAPEVAGEPIQCRAYVKTLSDGVFTHRGPMLKGVTLSVGKTAVIVVDGVTVIVTSAIVQVYDVEVFQRHGLIPNDFKIVVVKSSIHYRAAFGPISTKMYPVECPGMLPMDPKTVKYQNCQRKMYPLHPDVEKPILRGL